VQRIGCVAHAGTHAGLKLASDALHFLVLLIVLQLYHANHGLLQRLENPAEAGLCLGLESGCMEAGNFWAEEASCCCSYLILLKLVEQPSL
jgi:hypothetical protein